MSKLYDLAVVIGRFQPVHLGHQALFKSAAEQADTVLVIIGSAEQPRTIKNPFTYLERQSMIEGMTNGSDAKFLFAPVTDSLYEENKWVTHIQDAIYRAARANDDGSVAENICIVGHDKDDSTYYLKSFPAYNFVDAGRFIEVDEHPIDSTQIRNLMFNNQYTFIKSVLPAGIYETLKNNFFPTVAFDTLKEEFKFIQSYKEQWKAAPYPVTFNTVDGVVLQGGHILLVKRKAAPGAGLWALPGGFLDQNETSKQAVIRELREETRIKVPVPIMEANITYQQRFDHPERSLRGRTITEAFLIELPGPADGKLPKVKGADDALEAAWFPINEALEMSKYLFEDHHSIISMLTARAK